jgi:hypothetical protein
MSVQDLELARQAQQRGMILRILREDYAASMVSIGSLLRVLDSIGISISEPALSFHLMYMHQQGYLKIWRANEIAGYRTDRRGPFWVAPDTIVFAKLDARGLQLIDGDFPVDPKVAF